VQCWPDRRFAGSNFMIAFATAEGLLLDIISDTSFSDASNAACIARERFGQRMSAAPTDSARPLISNDPLSYMDENTAAIATSAWV
jgi:hypothetical protein